MESEAGDGCYPCLFAAHAQLHNRKRTVLGTLVERSIPIFRRLCSIDNFEYLNVAPTNTVSFGDLSREVFYADLYIYSWLRAYSCN